MKTCDKCGHSTKRHVDGICLTGLGCRCGRERIPKRGIPKPEPAKSQGRAAKQYSDAQRKAREAEGGRSEW